MLFPSKLMMLQVFSVFKKQNKNMSTKISGILLCSFVVDSVQLGALSDERFLAAGGKAAFAMSHERVGRN